MANSSWNHIAAVFGMTALIEKSLESFWRDCELIHNLSWPVDGSGKEFLDGNENELFEVLLRDTVSNAASVPLGV